jgi:hypothetical protein
MTTLSAKDRLRKLLEAKKNGAAHSTKPSGERGTETGAILGKPESTGLAGAAINTTSEKSGSSSANTRENVSASSSRADSHPLFLKLAELEVAIKEKQPDMPYVLKNIWDMLKEDTETVTLLTDEDIGNIVAGLTQHTNTTIIAAPKKSTSKKSQPISLDMLD